MPATQWSLSFATVVLVATGALVAVAADMPTVKQTMTFRPQQNDVEYDTPEPKQYDECKVTVVREGKASGWVVTGPAGQILRRFMDTNGDNVVDQWCYYKNGLEVYRDIDANFNNKIDQSRWLNTGGMRWGADANEDGRIDSWKAISADEVSRIAVRALVSQDATILASVLVTKEDLRELGIKGALEGKILSAVAEPAARLRKAVAGSKIINAKTSFTRFDASPPAAIPADTYKTPIDLLVLENGMAIVDYGNASAPGLVHIGELVRVGEVWKLTGLPSPLEGAQPEITPGILMYHALGTGASVGPPSVADAVPAEVQAIIEKKLNPLIQNPPAAQAARSVHEKYYRDLEDVLTELMSLVKTDDQRTQWTRQLLDTLAAGAQSGAYPAGIAKLKQLEAEIAKASPRSPLVAGAAYRRIVAEYFLAMSDAGDNDVRQKVQDRWLKELDAFVDNYPKSEEAPEAIWHLAQSYEFAGKTEKAKTWYERLSSDYSDAPAAPRAAGALRRLELNGKTLSLSGAALAGSASIDVKQFRGKIVAVWFWDTKSKLCAEDLPLIKALYEEYRASGFEILGVNLDPLKTDVAPYLMQNNVRWPQIHEPGGTESPLAKSFGIVALPTMFIVGADGKVTNRSATVAELKGVLAEELRKK